MVVFFMPLDLQLSAVHAIRTKKKTMMYTSVWYRDREVHISVLAMYPSIKVSRPVYCHMPQIRCSEIWVIRLRVCACVHACACGCACMQCMFLCASLARGHVYLVHLQDSQYFLCNESVAEKDWTLSDTSQHERASLGHVSGQAKTLPCN